MHHHDSDHHPDRPLSTHVNRHAIALAGHLLMAGVWIECRLMNVHRPRIRMDHRSQPRALSTLVVRTASTPVDLTRIEEL
jgi:hypothetical protein